MGLSARIWDRALLAPTSFGGGNVDGALPRQETGLNPKIRTFDPQGALGRGSDWKRTPNVTGTGATHVRSFHCKLMADALDNLDNQINEWLDQHPEYEVKFVTTTVGEWTGKLKEPNLIVQVWV